MKNEINVCIIYGEPAKLASSGFLRERLDNEDVVLLVRPGLSNSVILDDIRKLLLAPVGTA